MLSGGWEDLRICPAGRLSPFYEGGFGAEEPGKLSRGGDAPVWRIEQIMNTFYGIGCLCPPAGVGEEEPQSGPLLTPVISLPRDLG